MDWSIAFEIVLGAATAWKTWQARKHKKEAAKQKAAAEAARADALKSKANYEQILAETARLRERDNLAEQAREARLARERAGK